MTFDSGQQNTVEKLFMNVYILTNTAAFQHFRPQKLKVKTERQPSFNVDQVHVEVCWPTKCNNLFEFNLCYSRPAGWCPITWFGPSSPLPSVSWFSPCVVLLTVWQIASLGIKITLPHVNYWHAEWLHRVCKCTNCCLPPTEGDVT